MTFAELWMFQQADWADIDLRGFKVEARDGDIGKIDDATYEVGANHIVVDTGPWIFGKKVMIPAGVIERIDPDEEKVHVSLTKDEIKNAPEFDENTYTSEGYRSSLGDYYGRQKTGVSDRF
jgi:hypothetical protein